MKADIHIILDNIHDPEIPVLTIRDIGILRDVKKDGEKWLITITPTYSGCPAMNVIEATIAMELVSHGITNYKVITQLSPAWTTDWMTSAGKQKLEAYGIAPPNPPKEGEEQPIACPICKSTNVKEVSRFGSTACKSLWKCLTCLEPFDYFKCH